MEEVEVVHAEVGITQHSNSIIGIVYSRGKLLERNDAEIITFQNIVST